MDVVDKVRFAAMARYKELGYSQKTAEQLYDVFMDKLAFFKDELPAGHSYMPDALISGRSTTTRYEDPVEHVAKPTVQKPDPFAGRTAGEPGTPGAPSAAQIAEFKEMMARKAKQPWDWSMDPDVSRHPESFGPRQWEDRPRTDVIDKSKWLTQPTEHPKIRAPWEHDPITTPIRPQLAEAIHNIKPKPGLLSRITQMLGKRAMVTNMQSNVAGPGQSMVAGTANPLQAQSLRQKLNSKDTNIPMTPRNRDISVDEGLTRVVPGKSSHADSGYVNKAAAVSEKQLMVCKAAFICRMAQHGTAPLKALKLFDAQIEKYADTILDAFVPEDSKLQNVARAFTPMTPARRTKNYTRFMRRMENTGIANSQGIGGFTPMDEVSRRRIGAVLNGVISAPMTAGAVAVEGAKKLMG